MTRAPWIADRREDIFLDATVGYGGRQFHQVGKVLNTLAQDARRLLQLGVLIHLQRVQVWCRTAAAGIYLQQRTVCDGSNLRTH